MDAHSRFDTHIVGALPVITQYFDRLELGPIVDQLVPWEGDIPLGTLVEILIASRFVRASAAVSSAVIGRPKTASDGRVETGHA
jgi:hypothetical protein